jgi:hypothetical protein
MSTLTVLNHHFKKNLSPLQIKRLSKKKRGNNTKHH